jgi:hypothetical protein
VKRTGLGRGGAFYAPYGLRREGRQEKMALHRNAVAMLF